MKTLVQIIIALDSPDKITVVLYDEETEKYSYRTVNTLSRNIRNDEIITLQDEIKIGDPMKEDKARAIEIIEAHYPPDSDNINTKRMGSALLRQAKEDLKPNDWRNEEECVLALMAQICLDLEGNSENATVL